MGRFIDTDDLKKWVKDETAYDVDLYDMAIEAAEQFLDDETGGYIAVASDTATPATFQPRTPASEYLWITNCAEITSVVENGATLTANVDYVAEPRPKAAGVPRPYYKLRRIGARWYWNDWKDTVTVTARWGFQTLPAGGKMACLVAAKMHLDGRDLRSGLVGAADFGGITEREAKAVKDFLSNYKFADGWGIA